MLQSKLPAEEIFFSFFETHAIIQSQREAALTVAQKG